MGIAFMSGGARSVELFLCDITFQAMILLISIYFNLSHTDEISAMKYINHYS